MTQWGDETICLTSENWPEHYASVVEQEQVVEPVAEASGSSGLKVEIHSSTVFPPKQHLWTGASIGRAEQSKCQADQVKRPAANWIIGYNWMWVKMEDLGDHRC